MSIRRIAHWTGLALGAALRSSPQRAMRSNGRQPPRPRRRRRRHFPSLFFEEEWRQRSRPADAGPDFVPRRRSDGGGRHEYFARASNSTIGRGEHSGLSARTRRRARSRATGAALLHPARGFNQNPPPERVANGTPTDPAEPVDRRLPHGDRRNTQAQDELRGSHGARAFAGSRACRDFMSCAPS